MRWANLRVALFLLKFVKSETKYKVADAHTISW
jgi:hypothetical protein